MTDTLRNMPWGRWDIIALVVAVCGWGGNFIAIRYAVLELPVWTTLAIRFVLVGLVLVPFLRWPGKDFRWLIFTTLALAPGHFGLLFWASQVTTNVSAVSLFIQLGPAFSILFAWGMLGEVPGVRRITGLVLALIAVVILFYEPHLLQDHTALLIASGSATFMGIYTVMLRWPGVTMRPLDVIGWSSILSAPLAIAIAVGLEGASPAMLSDISWSAWGGVLYAAFVASIASHGSWAWLCRRHPLSQVAPFSLVSPVVAILLATLLFNEPLTSRFVLAAGVLFIGLYILSQAGSVVKRGK